MFLLLLVALVAPAAAVLREARGGRWSDAANWCPEGLPAAGDDGEQATFSKSSEHQNQKKSCQPPPQTETNTRRSAD